MMVHKIQASLFVLVSFVLLNCHANDQRESREQMLFEIGVIRDLGSPFGTMINLCIEMAVSDFYSANPNYKTRMRLHQVDVKHALDVDLAVVEFMKHKQVQVILDAQGPADEMFVAELGRKSHVPIISFAPAGGSELSENHPYFVRTTSVDDEVEAQALGAIFRELGWAQVVILYEDTESGYRFLSRLSKPFRDNGIGLARLTAIPTSANAIHLIKVLTLLNKNQTVKVFLVHMNPPLGFRLFTLAKELGMLSEGQAWIITDRLSNFLNSIDPDTRASMEGSMGVRPYVPFSDDLENFKERWKRDSKDLINVHGLWAYDMVTSLAISLEKIGEVRVSSSSFGPLLLKGLSGTGFRGLSGGDYGGNPRPLEIFNVVGTGEKRLGFWTADRGIVRELSLTTSTKGLRKVTWPGDTVMQPKGWSIPPSGVLRVGIPCNSGYDDFVRVETLIDHATKEADAKGFAVDIFLEAMKVLPFPMDHVFYCYGPLNNTDWSYDDMLQAIPEKFDMVVADVTIWAPRTAYVDFSLPYLESGSVLIVAKKELGMWSFTRPLSWDLWLAILVSCIFMGLTIWFLERVERNREDMVPYLAPVAFVAFQERKMVSKKSSVVVLVCWVFMASILMQSFTANLSAILTVDQMKFAFSEDYHLGYRASSFTKKFLMKNLNIDKSRLKGYITDEEFNDAMRIGSKKGGIDAIFDEIPYMIRFLKHYKSKYKIVGPTYSTAGLGFAFPIDSPLVANFSRAILNITDNKLREYYEEKNFGAGYASLPVLETTSHLTFHDFSGLFYVLLSAAVVAVICSETPILSMRFPWSNRDQAQHQVQARTNASSTIALVQHGGEQAPGQDQDHEVPSASSTIALVQQGGEQATEQDQDHEVPSATPSASSTIALVQHAGEQAPGQDQDHEVPSATPSASSTITLVQHGGEQAPEQDQDHEAERDMNNDDRDVQGQHQEQAPEQ